MSDRTSRTCVALLAALSLLSLALHLLLLRFGHLVMILYLLHKNIDFFNRILRRLYSFLRFHAAPPYSFSARKALKFPRFHPLTRCENNRSGLQQVHKFVTAIWSFLIPASKKLYSFAFHKSS